MIAKERGNAIYDAIQELFDQSKHLDDMIDEAIKDGHFADQYSKDFLVRIMGFMPAHFDKI